MRLTVEQAQELDNEEKVENCKLYRKGMRAHKAKELVLTASGPLLPILLLPGAESGHHPLGRGHDYYN